MRIARLSFVMVLFIASIVRPTEASAEPLSTPTALRMTRLALELAIDYQESRIEGIARIELENTADHSAGELSLLLGRLMTAASVTDLDGRNLAFRQAVVIFADDPARQVNQILLPLEPPVPPGGRFTVSVHYGGVLVGYTETGSLYIQDHVDPAFTVVREDAYAFPVVAVPSSTANRAAPRADFAYEATVTVPEGETVANGGELVGREAVGALVRWTYRSRGPAPFLNLAIAPYERLIDQGVTVFALPQDRRGGAHVLERSRSAMQLFARWLGPPPAEPRFAVIEIPAGFGSQANLVAGIIQEADVFQAKANMQPLYHELSHFWNTPDAALSCRWNEGLAMYLQGRAARALDGWTGGEEDLARCTKSLRELGAKDPRLASVPYEDYGSENVTDWSYAVGSLFFALLERAEGEEGLRKLVREYQQQHRLPEPCTDFAQWLRARGTRSTVALVHDWFETTAWWPRVAGGATFAELTASYGLAARP